MSPLIRSSRTILAPAAHLRQQNELEVVLSNEEPNVTSVSLRQSPSTSFRTSSELTMFKQDTDIQQHVATHPRQSVYFSLCNTVLGVVGLLLATSFGVITIVQTNAANREAKLANQLAWNSIILRRYQTCTQGSDLVCCSFRICIKLNF